MSFNFTGLQNKERGKGHPGSVKGAKKRNKLRINTQITAFKTVRSKSTVW